MRVDTCLCSNGKARITCRSTCGAAGARSEDQALAGLRARACAQVSPKPGGKRFSSTRDHHSDTSRIHDSQTAMVSRGNRCWREPRRGAHPPRKRAHQRELPAASPNWSALRPGHRSRPVCRAAWRSFHAPILLVNPLPFKIANDVARTASAGVLDGSSVNEQRFRLSTVPAQRDR